MENKNNEYYQNHSGFELLLKTSRETLNSSGDNKNDAKTRESVEDADISDENSGETEKGSRDVVTLQENVDDAFFDTGDKVSLDSIMSVAPDNELVTEVNDVINAESLESSMEKLNIEDEGFDTIENIISKTPYSLVNTRALPKELTTYALETFKKHTLIIFNHKEIDGYRDRPRLGTEKDVEALTKTFGNFGFEVTSHDDLPKDGIFDELKKFSSRNFTDYGCVAVAILTHGSNKGQLWAKDQLYSEIEVINQFNDQDKPYLATKPKIFIVQACRGKKIMTGMPVFSRQSGKIRKDSQDEEDLDPYILPVESDLLILHSSYPGRASHRDELSGSWFIQTLCNKIDCLSPAQDLESIFTEVKRDVAIHKQHEEYNRRTQQMNVNKQMPIITSTLIRKLYLKKFGEKPSKETYVDKSRRRSESRHEIMDAESTAPTMPLLVQFGPCNCFLEHFTYMRNCLRYFVAENPDDEQAQNILEIANTLEDSVISNKLKDKICKAISKHLMDNARNSQFSKYLHFCNAQAQSPVGTTEVLHGGGPNIFPTPHFFTFTMFLSLLIILFLNYIILFLLFFLVWLDIE